MSIPQRLKDALSSPLILGTRGSLLALWQANFIKHRLEKYGIDVEIKTIKTKGDKILDAPLAKIGGKGLFTKELENELLSGGIDFAVHSLKDVPIIMESRLMLSAITKRVDCRDCFVSYKYSSLESMPKDSKVGTTSLRRAMQIRLKNPHLEVLNLRGNVQTRLEKLSRGEYDAVILASAALLRLGFLRDDSYNSYMLDSLDMDNESFLKLSGIPSVSMRNDMNIRFLDFMIASMGQGSLGLQCRDPKYFSDFRDYAIAKILESLNHRDSALCCNIEREFIRLLGGGCQSPIGIHAEMIGNRRMRISCIAGNLSATRILEDSRECDIGEAEHVLRDMINTLRANGVDDILSEVTNELDRI